MKYIMNNKILAVFIGFSLMLGLGLATTNTVLDAWNDEPGYSGIRLSTGNYNGGGNL